MGFYKIVEEPGKKNEIIVKPEYSLVDPETDLMTRGGKFYAIWNGTTWSTDELDVIRVIDPAIEEYTRKASKKNPDVKYIPSYLNNFRYRNNAAWSDYAAYIRNRPAIFTLLDQKLTFASDTRTKKDYTSKRLPYDIAEGPIVNYDELMSVIFSPSERQKLEWAVGSIISGDSVFNQKFVVLYGESGTGKSTFLNIVEQIFSGYVSTFNAKALGRGDSFATSAFKTGPLVAIEHDGDLSRVLDNTRLNSIIAHEPIFVNDKYEKQYALRLNAFIFMGTNQPVQITDSKSGLIRRLIDVQPTGVKIDSPSFHALVDGVRHEIPAIAYHCLNVYLELGRNYYDTYKPITMMSETDTVYNFVEEHALDFANEDFVTLKRAFAMYKEYVEDSGLKFMLPKHKFKAEIKSYFKEFHHRRKDMDGRDIYNVYSMFRTDRFESTVWIRSKPETTEQRIPFSADIPSVLDMVYRDQPAQLANSDGNPRYKWANCNTTLATIDTKQLHYVKLPENHIVIDFDLKDARGNKSLARNIEVASQWPITYAELSKSGEGIHLHYIYDGDATELRRIYDDDIEVKVFTGDASLRRRLTKCTNNQIAHISTGLPKGVKKVIDKLAIADEQMLRRMIEKNLKKEYHSATKPSIDFIKKILDDAYATKGFVYDVRDMRQAVLKFAMGSSNQAQLCVATVAKMKFISKETEHDARNIIPQPATDKIVFFDVEVFKNLFVVVYKFLGEQQKYRLINPSPELVGKLFDYRLIGFNNKKYDNHILYGAYLGYSNMALYKLSSSLINNKTQEGEIPGFAPAYGLSYSDIYDFSTKRQSLKKWEIELKLFHRELDIPWDEEVPEARWDEVVDYCENDVDATEAVFLDREQDWTARLILSELSGLTPNHSTRSHTARIIFGNDKNPQSKFVYTDLSVDFPGYTFDPFRTPKSLYKGEEPSEGGYVYAEPGMYENVSVFDVASMHPSSLINMNMFGPYTKRFDDLLRARIAIKHADFDTARKALDGALVKYLTTKESAKKLAYPLKIALNTVYGLTKARFPNEFLDPRNKDNIVAKRGALFMIDLKGAVQQQGYQVVHIKTDSIKIVDADDKIIAFIHEFGKKFGYIFEHEHTYSKFCLVNDAVYIAKIGWSEDDREIGTWSATGAQFAHPYVFKTLFSQEDITFDDLCETKEVKAGRMYLKFIEDVADPSDEEGNLVHVGKVGSFVPVKPNTGGGVLLSKNDKTGKYGAVTGTKGWFWKEAIVVEQLKLEEHIDMAYFHELASKAIDKISIYGNFDSFVSK